MALSFAFDASAETPQSTATKRALIAQIMGSMKTPRNIGEGFSALGDGIVANVLGSRAAEAEKAGQTSANDTFSQLVASITGQGAMPSIAPATATDATAAMASVPSGDQAGYIRQGLIDRGLPEHVADAFLLNMQDESGLNPGINEANPTVPGSRGGYGLYQLTGPRRVAYEQYAQRLGVDPSNVDAQLDFLMSELQGPEAQAYQSIMAAPDTGSAAAAIVNDFLRPAEEHRARRAAQYTGGAPTQVAQGPDLAMLMEAAANPWLSDSQKSVINSMIAQQMQQQDPAYQLGLEKLGLEVAGMRNPPAPQPEYGFTFAPDGTLIRTDATSGTIDPMGQFAKPVEPGFRQLSPEEVAQAGLDPEKSWQVAPTGEIKQIGGGGVNVSVNGERGFDKTVGEGYGKRFLEIQDSAQAAQRTLDGLSVMEQAMADPNFYSGSGEAYVSGLKRLGAAIGINPDSVSSNETFNAMAKQAALDSMGGSLGTGFSNADRDFVTDQVPTLSNTPEGNRKLIEIQRKLNERKQQIAEQARLYAQSHDGRIDAGFDDAIAQWARDNPLFPEATTSGSVPQSTVSPGDIESLVQKYLVP